MYKYALCAIAVLGFSLVGSQPAQASDWQVYVNGGNYGFAVGSHNHYNRGYSRYGYSPSFRGYSNYGYRNYNYGRSYNYHPRYPHFDYHPGQFNRHGNHYHYQPGHYHLHR
ncbi:hypothetical protein [Rubinisphaera sp.]|uniref:hypothetical protein n=1 Tax=Rubinisphaera sp. TaxID=2024857 RepID=UPI0025F9493E|nr:hypothetical protein [Rubinisphaera sp.]